MTEAIIRTEELRKHFGKLEVLRGITTEIRRGEVVSIDGGIWRGTSRLDNKYRGVTYSVRLVRDAQ